MSDVPPSVAALIGMIIVALVLWMGIDVVAELPVVRGTFATTGKELQEDFLDAIGLGKLAMGVTTVAIGALIAMAARGGR